MSNKSMKSKMQYNNSTLPVEFNIINRQFFPGMALWRHEAEEADIEQEDSFMSVKGNSKLGFPGEFEQRVFFALVMLMKENRYEREFYVSIVEILSALGEKNKNYYSRIKTSLKILTDTIYYFKNCFYSNKQGGILKEELIFSLLHIQSITRTDVTSDSIKQFTDGRIKEVYKITMAKEIHENIVLNGYLAVNIDKLNKLDNIYKNLYLFLEKTRNREKILVRPLKVIAERLSISVEKKNISRTFTLMDKYLNKLKGEGLIEDFSITKNVNFEKAMLKVNYNEKHNESMKENLKAEKQYRNGCDLHKYRVEQSIEKISDEIKDIDSLLMLYPEIVRNSSNLQKGLKEAVEKYGMERVRYAAEYVALYKPKNHLKYTIDVLEKNWDEEYRLKKQYKKVKEEKIKEENTNRNIAEVEDKTKLQNVTLYLENFSNLTDKEKHEIEDKVYKEYLEETKSLDNKLSRGIFEKSRKAFISKELYSMIEKGLISLADYDVKKIGA